MSLLDKISFWKKTTIFLSSTYLDLKNDRKLLFEELESKGYKVIKMEDLDSSKNIDVIDWSLDNAMKCDIYLCLLSYRYGNSLSKFEINELQNEDEDWSQVVANWYIEWAKK